MISSTLERMSFSISIVEALHSFFRAVAHGIEQRFSFGFAFLHVLARAQRGFQNLEGGDAAGAVGLGNQALRNDVAERFREAPADGGLVGIREDADDALDRFRSVNGVQRGIHQVAGFRGFQRHFDGFLVAHFADQDQFRRLAQSGAQGQRETGRVGVKFALVNGGAFVRVQKFDGVFDRDDVAGLFFVDLVDERRERGGFSAARSAR